MKKWIMILAVVVMSMMTSVARCENPERMFARFAQRDAFEYAYISPRMVSLQGKEMVGDLPVEKIRLVEMVNTHLKGDGKEMKEAISSTISRNGMMLMSTQDSKCRRNDFYATWDEERDIFTHLLLMKYLDPKHCDTRLMYLVGDFTLEDISKLF